MSHKIKTEKDVAVLTVKGNLMGGKETDSCHQKLKELLNEGHKKIVIDLSNVKWMNSKGLGMLIACLTSTKNADGTLKMASATEKVKSLFMITKLIEIFENYESSEKAVASFLK